MTTYVRCFKEIMENFKATTLNHTMLALSQSMPTYSGSGHFSVSFRHKSTRTKQVLVKHNTFQWDKQVRNKAQKLPPSFTVTSRSILSKRPITSVL